MYEKGQAFANRQGELELESLPLPREVFVVADALRPIAEEIKSRFAYESYSTFGSQGGKEVSRIRPYPLGMYAEAGDCRRELSPQRLRSGELPYVVRHDSSAPVWARHERGKTGIPFKEVDEMEVSVAIHRGIVADAAIAVNGR